MTFDIEQIVFFKPAGIPVKVIGCNSGRTAFAIEVPFQRKQLAHAWQLREMREDMDIKVRWRECDWMPKGLRA